MARFLNSAAFGTVCISIVGLFSIQAANADSPPRVDPNFPNVQPSYPDEAQTKGEQGAVGVDVLVRPSGRPMKAKIAQSSGFVDLDAAAIQGVLNWRFVPALKGGDTVSQWTTVRIVYQLPVPAAVAPVAKP